MAEFPDSATKPPDSADIAQSIVAEFSSLNVVTRIGTGLTNTALEAGKLLLGFGFSVIGTVVAKVAQVMIGVLNAPQAEYEQIASKALDVMIGDSSVPAAPGRTQTDEAARKIINNLTSGGQAPTPSTEPAERWMGEVVRMSVQSWVQGFIAEAATDAIPFIDGLETYGALEDKLEATMGLGRLSRQVLNPYVHRTVVEPLEWALNKQYRSQQLTLSQAIRAWRGGFITDAEFGETYGRHGYTDRLARAVAAETQKRHTVDDYELLFRVGRATRDQLVQSLKEDGFDLSGAENEADIPRIKRIVAFERAMANDAVAAYATGRITDRQLDDFIDGNTIDDEERNQLRELAAAKRLLRRKGLSPSEARAAVEAGVASMQDYERALRDDGYEEDAIDTLILTVRKKLDDRADAATLKAQRAAERAREKAARDERARERRAEAERVRALRRRGSESDLERAVVRGLIPIARYVEILRDDFDLDTVDIMTDLVEAERADYLADQAAAEEADQRARRSGLSLGALRAAVFAGQLAVPEFRAALDRAGLAAADADLLTRTLGAQLADRAAAEEARQRAADAARVRSISLPQFERLVRRGARSLADYDALLRSLGFDEPSRAALRELLQIQIADDAAQRARAEAAAAAARQKGLSLEQWRRAVVLGIRTRDAYQTMLVQHGFTADAIGALLALLDVDVAEAEDARRRRAATDAPPDARRVPLATVARAARLGVVTPATYQARLVAAGYTPDDVAIELGLLVTEIAEVQAARQRQAEAVRPPADRGLTLPQLARAVRLDLAPIDAYRARAIALGFAAADVELLVAMVTEERDQARATRARRAALLEEPALDGAALGALFDQVRAGTLAIADLGARLAAAGLPADDVEILIALVVDEQAGG